MASRAEPAVLTATSPERSRRFAGSLGGAIRAALSDGFYHSWRLVPANVLWAVTAIAIGTAVIGSPLAILALPLLALPTAGVFRIATRIARGEAVSAWDAIDAWREDVRLTLGIGAAFVLATVVLSANTVIGLAGATPVGWAIATLAAWGLVVLWMLAWTVWPIVVDPARADRSVRDRLRLAGLLVLAHPLRIGALALVLGLFLALSTIAIVALVTISVAFATLVAARYVLPAADRLEEQLAGPATPSAA